MQIPDDVLREVEAADDILDNIARLRDAMFFSQDGGEIGYLERRIAEEEAALARLRKAMEAKDG